MTEQVHRHRCVIDFYAFPLEPAQRERIDTLIRTFMSAIFPLGIVEGYPDVYDLDETSLKTLGIPFRE